MIPSRSSSGFPTRLSRGKILVYAGMVGLHWVRGLRWVFELPLGRGPSLYVVSGFVPSRKNNPGAKTPIRSTDKARAAFSEVPHSAALVFTLRDSPAE